MSDSVRVKALREAVQAIATAAEEADDLTNEDGPGDYAEGLIRAAEIVEALAASLPEGPPLPQDKCDVCGGYRSDPAHAPMGHRFVPAPQSTEGPKAREERPYDCGLGPSCWHEPRCEAPSGVAETERCGKWYSAGRGYAPNAVFSCGEPPDHSPPCGPKPAEARYDVPVSAPVGRIVDLGGNTLTPAEAAWPCPRCSADVDSIAVTANIDGDTDLRAIVTGKCRGCGATQRLNGEWEPAEAVSETVRALTLLGYASCPPPTGHDALIVQVVATELARLDAALAEAEKWQRRYKENAKNFEARGNMMATERNQARAERDDARSQLEATKALLDEVLDQLDLVNISDPMLLALLSRPDVQAARRP